MTNKQSLFIIAAGFMLISCGKQKISVESSADFETLQKERDSLVSENEQYAKMTDFIISTFDSIQVKEQLLFADNGEVQNVREKKTIVIERLDNFADLIRSQREQILEMSEQLKANSSLEVKMKKLLEQVYAQLAQKDKEIHQLKVELQESKKSIEQLRVKVDNLSEENKMQEEILVAQDEMLNECYYKVGTKNELKAAGIFSKGTLLKKGKVNLSNLKKEGFQQVDIRDFKELFISGKKAKILTPAPPYSFRIVETEGGYLLKITNPTEFWKVSNFLVIQSD